MSVSAVFSKLPRETGEAGFTLIEMLVVLTVIGLLATIALSNLSIHPAFVDRAKLHSGLGAALAAARQQAAASGKSTAIDLTKLGVSGIGYQPTAGGGYSVLMAFPDGSTNGGTVTVAGRAAVAISWMTGQVSDAPH